MNHAIRAFLTPVTHVSSRSADPDSARYVRSYLIMRTAVGAIGVILPFALMLIDGLWFGGEPFFRSSLSAYYYSGMRDVFVGALSALGIFLVTYKVAEINLDNTLSITAGIAVLIVALFPTGRPGDSTSLTSLQDRLGESVVQCIHFTAAALFIASLAVLSYYFGEREGGRPPRPGRRSPKFWQTYHWICTGAIAAALAWCAVAVIFDSGPRESLLIGETVAVVAFGASWLWKGLEFDLLDRRHAKQSDTHGQA